jgi:hypothetical protein
VTFRLRPRSGAFRILAVLWSVVFIAAVPATVLAGGGPSNDDFANAKLIVGNLPYNDSVNSAGASDEGDEQDSECDSSANRSVWWKITMTRNRVVQVSTIGSNYDTQIDIFTGPNLANLTFIDCNNDIDSNNPDLYNARVNFRAKGGQRYFIRVTDTAEGDGGMASLHVRTIQAPGNDNFAGAKRIFSLPFDANADATNATIQPDEPQENYCDVARATRWYKFTPNEDMVIWANTFVPRDFDTVLAVYTGSSISNAQQIVCNDDTWVSSDITYASGVTFKAHAGVTYRFQVAGYDAESGDNRRLPFHVERVTPAPNDDFVNAMAVGPLPFSHSTNMRRTTVQGSEPGADCLNSGFLYNTAWYEFVPSTTSTYEVSVSSGITEADPLVHVYEVTGPGFGGLTHVDCSDNVTFTGNAGTTYMIQTTLDQTQTAPVELVVDFD